MKLLLVLALISLLSVSYACHCMVQPVEKLFCNSEFAIQIKVKSELHKSDDQLQAYYDVEVMEVFKTDEKTKTALTSNRIWTTSDGATCGRFFELDEVYIITGSVDANGTKARTHLCAFGRNIKQLSEAEKEFFLKGFKSVSCLKTE